MSLPTEAGEWVQIIVFVATAVWAVSKIRSTTDVLSISMGNLATSLNRLDVRVEAVSKDLLHLRDRMTILETKLETRNSRE